MVTDNTSFIDQTESVEAPKPDNTGEAASTETDVTEDSNTTTAVENIPTPTVEVTSEATTTPPSDTLPTTAVDPDRLNALEGELRKQREENEKNQIVSQLEREALSYEKKLLDQGNSEEDARSQTFQFLNGRMQQVQSEQQRTKYEQILQAKRKLSIKLVKDNGLTIDDLEELERANTPQEMHEKARIKSVIAKQQREIMELKRERQGGTQQFDNSTPSPAAGISNQDRLIDAYNNGDRSEAAVAAVRKLQGF